MTPEWKPIASLPHDGDEADRQQCGQWYGPVLLYIPDEHGGVMLVAQMDSDSWIVGPDEYRRYHPLEKAPTHWMELPEPPDVDGARHPNPALIRRKGA